MTKSSAILVKRKVIMYTYDHVKITFPKLYFSSSLSLSLSLSLSFFFFFYSHFIYIYIYIYIYIKNNNYNLMTIGN